MKMTLEDRKFKTGYEALGCFNMSGKYLVQKLKKIATPIEWMLLEIVARHEEKIERIITSLIESVKLIASDITKLKTKINGEKNDV